MSAAISGLGMAVAPQAMTGASMRMPPAQKMANLFSQIDTTGSGSITKSQFENAFSSLNPPAGFKAMGADAVFSKLDPNGMGSVSKQDFINDMTKMMSEIRQQIGSNISASQVPDPTQTINASLGNLNNLAVGANINTIA
jgi:Ca2+-binding EF-hand superfamily protein